MTNREKLQHLIDDLSEADVDEALQYITWQRENGFTNLLHGPPTEQPIKESQTPEEPPASGEVIFLDEIKRGQEYGHSALSESHNLNDATN